MADRALLQRPIAQSCIRGHGHSDGGPGTPAQMRKEALRETPNNGNGILHGEVLRTVRPLELRYSQQSTSSVSRKAQNTG